MVKNNKTKNKSSQKEDIFSFDNEIVIGVTNLNKEKDEKKDRKKDKSKSKVKKKNKRKEKREETKINTIKKDKNKKSTNKIKSNNKAVIKNKTNNNRNIEYEENLEINQEKVKTKKHINKNLIKYVMILIAIAIVIICAMFSPLFNIKEIIVQGNEKISQEQIISLSKIQKGDNTYKISNKNTEKLIKENAYIESVKIIRKLPSTIIIEVEERKPSYIIEYSNQYLYVDKNGYILEISEEKPELPILQGLETNCEEFKIGNKLCIEDLRKILITEKIMQLAINNDINKLITRIEIENKQNIQLIFEDLSITAHIGDESNINTKLLTIKAILEKIEGKSGEIFVDMDLNKEYPIFRQSV